MPSPAINASLFKNDRKEQDNQPDFTGPGTVTPENLKAIYDAAVSDKAVFDEKGAIKVRVAGWRKESAKGLAYISLSLQLEVSRPADQSTAKKGSGDLF